MAPVYATFPEEEHRKRFDRARIMLRNAEVDGCICMSPETLYYLTGYDSWTAMNNTQALIFGVGHNEPTLLIRDVDLPLARESAWITDVRTYHLNTDDSASIIIKIARDKGIRNRAGIDLQSAAVTGAFALALAAAFQPGKIVDATMLLGDLRLVKSNREMALIRQAAGYAKAGLRASRTALRAGRSEIAVGAEVEAAVRAAGSDYWSIPTEFSSGPRSAGCHATPRSRMIELGELTHFEFAGVAARYHATAITTMAVGEPGRRARDLHRLNAASLRAGIAAIRPGCPAAAVEEASLEPLRREGLDRFAMMRFGYGIGIGYPPVWLETLQIDRHSTQRIEVGMVFVLHACIELTDERLGAIQGGAYVLTENGLEMLVGDGDADLVIV